jgi:small subunit ribosomal protein S1
MSKKSSSKTSSEPQSAMAALLAKHQDKFVALKKGESVKGKITKLTKQEILVDLGTKTEAVILEKDRDILNTILASFKEGDTVEVNVLNPESEHGHPVVSLRRYLGNIAWGKLEKLVGSKDTIEATITDSGKAGYVASTSFGVSGFLPQSHATSSDIIVGKKIDVAVIEVSREDNKVILSQKPKVSDEEFESVMKKYKIGQKVEVEVSNITPFGIFVALAGYEGFIHISEVSWDKVDDISDIYTVGDKIEAAIIRFDKDSKRINLSVKKLSADPFEKLMEDYPVDRKVSGKVVSIDDAGINVELESGAEGFIKKEKIPPTTTYSEGQEISLTVAEHDKRRHRINLTPVLKEKPIGYR